MIYGEVKAKQTEVYHHRSRRETQMQDAMLRALAIAQARTILNLSLKKVACCVESADGSLCILHLINLDRFIQCYLRGILPVLASQ
jgi:hypothetical protein